MAALPETALRQKAKDFIASLKHLLDEIPLEKVEAVTELLYRAYRADKQVFIMGNGGSASTASHFVCDLGKETARQGTPRFRVIGLNDNVPLMTALSNDFGYASVFKEQLVNLVNEGDIVIGITGSGNSANVLEAITYARSRKAVTIGLIGFGGGRLKDLVDEAIVISSTDYGHVESVHLVLEHLITEIFRARIGHVP